MSLYTDAIAELAEEMATAMQEFMAESFDVTPDREQLRVAFEQAIQSQEGLAAFEQQYGKEAVDKQIGLDLRRMGRS